jgi:hypothetical protein
MIVPGLMHERENYFFGDVEIGDTITLDIDIFVEDWLLLEKEKFLKRVQDIEAQFDCLMIQAHYRESSNRNIHIKIEFNKPLSMLECLLFRAWFDDDQALLYIDMKRYFATMDKDNRFMRRFDCKGKINDQGEFEIAHAGPWKLIY